MDSSAAAPMDEEPSDPASSMLDLASDDALTRGMAETRYFMKAHQQIIQNVVTGAGITGGGDAASEGLLEKFKKVMASAFQEVGDV